MAYLYVKRLTDPKPHGPTLQNSHHQYLAVGLSPAKRATSKKPGTQEWHPTLLHPVVGAALMIRTGLWAQYTIVIRNPQNGTGNDLDPMLTLTLCHYETQTLESRTPRPEHPKS